MHAVCGTVFFSPRLKKRLWDDPQPEGLLLLRKPGAIPSSKLTGCELENCHRNS
jgi:hypothetical protein